MPEQCTQSLWPSLLSLVDLLLAMLSECVSPQVLQQKAAAVAQLTRLKARSEATCDRLKSDITSIRQQKARSAAFLPRTQGCLLTMRMPARMMTL